MNFEEGAGWEEAECEDDSADHYKLDQTNKWAIITEQILDPNKNMKDLKRALDKIVEITEHQSKV